MMKVEEESMKKFLSFLLSFFAVTQASPVFRQIGISEEVRVLKVNGTDVCQVDGKLYHVDEDLPTENPCEYCTCQPPGFACQIIKCEHKPGCRTLERSELCCPEYVCDCEFKRRIYQNGDRIKDEEDPCMDCFCVTGEVVCSVISCGREPIGCKSQIVKGRCCPLYECPDEAEAETESSLQDNSEHGDNKPEAQLEIATEEVFYVTEPIEDKTEQTEVEEVEQGTEGLAEPAILVTEIPSNLETAEISINRERNEPEKMTVPEPSNYVKPLRPEADKEPDSETEATTQRNFNGGGQEEEFWLSLLEQSSDTDSIQKAGTGDISHLQKNNIVKSQSIVKERTRIIKLDTNEKQPMNGKDNNFVKERLRANEIFEDFVEDTKHKSKDIIEKHKLTFGVIEKIPAKGRSKEAEKQDNEDKGNFEILEEETTEKIHSHDKENNDFLVSTMTKNKTHSQSIVEEDTETENPVSEESLITESPEKEWDRKTENPLIAEEDDNDKKPSGTERSILNEVNFENYKIHTVLAEEIEDTTESFHIESETTGEEEQVNNEFRTETESSPLNGLVEGTEKPLEEESDHTQEPTAEEEASLRDALQISDVDVAEISTATEKISQTESPEIADENLETERPLENESGEIVKTESPAVFDHDTDTKEVLYIDTANERSEQLFTETPDEIGDGTQVTEIPEKTDLYASNDEAKEEAKLLENPENFKSEFVTEDVSESVTERPETEEIKWPTETSHTKEEETVTEKSEDRNSDSKNETKLETSKENRGISKVLPSEGRHFGNVNRNPSLISVTRDKEEESIFHSLEDESESIEKKQRVRLQLAHLARKYGLRPLTKKTFSNDIGDRRKNRLRDRQKIVQNNRINALH